MASKPRAFIIGNGTSRKDFDLWKLHGCTFGCNAIYKDFKPDYIVAIDRAMIRELNQQRVYPLHRILVPPEPEHWEAEEFNPGQRRRSNAGMNAIGEAIKRGYRDLVCLGFDFLIKDENIAMANVYDGHSCYGPETRATADDNLNRVKYMQWVINTSPDVDFCFVFPRQELEIYDLQGGNVSGKYYDQLEAELNDLH